MLDKKFEELSCEEIERIIEEMMENSPKSPAEKKDSATRAKLEIIKVYVVLNTTRKDKTVFSKVRWGKIERYDIRKWDLEMAIPFKGITFSKDELKKFINIQKPTHISIKPSHMYESGKVKAYIYDTILTLSTFTFRKLTWSKQINMVDWGYGRKFDMRKWTDTYDKCSKGICLDSETFTKFYNTVLSVLREE